MQIARKDQTLLINLLIALDLQKQIDQHYLPKKGTVKSTYA